MLTLISEYLINFSFYFLFQRGGYTISELFHLASSSQPNQRRIALSSLAAALAASRRGYHTMHLATPSLLPSLLLCRPPGICFLLRWGLDRCVSEASCASSVTATDGGVSVAIVGECLRALNNLLVDDQGEVGFTFRLDAFYCYH